VSHPAAAPPARPEAASPFAPALPPDPLVLITGGGGGLGREIAGQFVARGARVHLCDLDAAGLDSFAGLHGSGKVRHTVADIGDSTDSRRLFADLDAWGTPVSVLINNVGIAGVRAPVDELDDAAWLQSLQANFLGAARCVRHVAAGMKQARTGLIVNISTVSVRTLPPSRAPYVVSKAALESYSLMLARELGPSGVRSNVIRPGGMDNERLRRVIQRIAEAEGVEFAAVLERALGHTWMHTLVSMRDVAAMVLHLASDAAKHVTGQVIEVDGGVDWEG
jgi:NAD(P)-dependent dehydrogenase (short-subunit alcohol dehydrogenase family)